MENGDPMVSLLFSYPFDLKTTIYYITGNTSPFYPGSGQQTAVQLNQNEPVSFKTAFNEKFDPG